MRTPKELSLVRRMLRARVKRMAARGPVLTASLVRIAKQCGRAGCRCQRGEKHVGNCVTYKEKGKTRTVYVPLSQLEEVTAWSEEARRLRALMQESTQLCLALIRGRARIRREQRLRERGSEGSSSAR